MIGKIIEKGGKKIFIPVSAMPGEEEIFPAMEQKALPTPLTPTQRKKIARQALKASIQAKKGIITSRPGASIAKEFYHIRSYSTDFAGKNRVEFFNVFGDVDGLESNIPSPYFKTEALLTGVRLEINPPALLDTGAYNYLSVIQALYNAILQIRLNDGIVWSVSVKDIAPELRHETEVIPGTPPTVYSAITLLPAKPKKFGDAIKDNFIMTTINDKLSILIISKTAFPSLGAGATDLYIKPIIRARVPQRIVGG